MVNVDNILMINRFSMNNSVYLIVVSLIRAMLAYFHSPHGIRSVSHLRPPFSRDNFFKRPFSTVDVENTPTSLTANVSSSVTTL